MPLPEKRRKIERLFFYTIQHMFEFVKNKFSIFRKIFLFQETFSGLQRLKA